MVLGESPIVQHLIAEGDAAVEPLIRTFRFDDRLTRSVGFHRNFFRSRIILRADQAAYTALTGILKTRNFAPQEQNEPAKGPINRDTLANDPGLLGTKPDDSRRMEAPESDPGDDAAGDAAWLEAAGNIIQPENVRIIPGGGVFTLTETSPVKPGYTAPVPGEPLRGPRADRRGAMARRMESMMKTPEGQRFHCSTPAGGPILAEWDPAAAVPTLRELTRICREHYARPDSGHDWTSQNLAVSIARFSLARDKGGDTEALREYAEWVRTTSPDWLDHNILAVLEPLHRKPDDPTLASAAAWLFGDPQSPWIPLIGRKGSRASYHVAGLIASPMVKVPAFRKMLLAALEDRRADRYGQNRRQWHCERRNRRILHGPDRAQE